MAGNIQNTWARNDTKGLKQRMSSPFLFRFLVFALGTNYIHFTDYFAFLVRPIDTLQGGIFQ